jgi:hypothetical protein
MANSVVTVTGTSASPGTVTIHVGDTVTWEGVSDFQIHMPGFSNPSVAHNPTSGKYHGTSAPFPARGANAYNVPYTISANGAVADPDVQVLP